MPEFMQVIITFLAGLISAFLIWGPTQKRIVMENVTQERRKWRETIRSKSIEVYDAIVAQDCESLHRLKSEFRTLVNPEDDKDIIEAISSKNTTRDTKYKKAECFTKKISSLLKQDWERAKLETRFVIFRFKWTYDIPRKIFYIPKRCNCQNQNKLGASIVTAEIATTYDWVQRYLGLVSFAAAIAAMILIFSIWMLFNGTIVSCTSLGDHSHSAF